ncbi:uncharacterized protein LOC135844585 [Planococcus citri]|uniref:uncharacterized protein LOC135843989 n=1 Tax=Planococcus citri TaxID=170843 RepID=UPI0031F78D08
MDIIRFLRVSVFQCTVFFSSAFFHSSMYVICETCGIEFSRQSNLNRHQRKIHNVAVESQPKNKWKCALCEFGGSPTAIREHYGQTHELQLETESLKFAGENSFKEWKYEIEKESVCKYVLLCGERNGITHYYCHRAGNFESKGKNKRHLKTQGSKRIGAYCPAQIKVFKDPSNSSYPIQVEFCKTHVGHENELCHITLSPKTKQKVAAKLLDHVPPEAIIDEVRNNVTSNEFERIHLLTTMDIYNISKEFGITAEYQKDSNDAASVYKFVQELRESNGGSSILYYKPQDVIDETYPELKSDDFVLILMNKPQIEMLQHYGNDVISIDGTHGMSYDFQLFTLLVLDDIREGFPCSFMVTNREDEQIMKIYFSVIRSFCGQITCKVFMSDMANQFSNAWNAIMGTPEYQLYCAWHVDNAWQKNLTKITNDATGEKKTFAYQVVKTLMEELDQNKFTLLLEEAVNTLKADESTLEYGKYFESHYYSNYKKWAYCYRIGAGINTNNHLERMHGTFKYVYLKGRKVGRLDKSLFFLMRFTRNKLFNRVIVENKGKISYKLRCVRKRHSTSKKMQNLITETNSTADPNGPRIYLVAASSGESNYEVSKNPEPVHQSCKLVCNDCSNTCIHQYVCTCVDNAIKFNMCKHIHHVIQHQMNNSHSNIAPLDSQSVNDVHPSTGESNDKINATIFNELKVADDLNAVDEYYAKGRALCKDDDSRRFFLKEMKKMVLKLECQDFKSFSPSKCASRAAESKRKRGIVIKSKKSLQLTPQKRLFSTKKKEKTKKNKQSKPSSLCKDAICNELILPTPKPIPVPEELPAPELPAQEPNFSLENPKGKVPSSKKPKENPKRKVPSSKKPKET